MILFSTPKNLAQGQKKKKIKKTGIIFEKLWRISLIISCTIISYSTRKKTKVSCDIFVLHSILHVSATLSSHLKAYIDVHCLRFLTHESHKNVVTANILTFALNVHYLWYSSHGSSCRMSCDGQLGYLSQKQFPVKKYSNSTEVRFWKLYHIYNCHLVSSYQSVKKSQYCHCHVY